MRALCLDRSRHPDAPAAGFAGLGVGGSSGAFHHGGGGVAGCEHGAHQSPGQRQRAVSALDDAGAAHLLLCERHLQQPAHRAAHARECRGAAAVRGPASGSRQRLHLPAGKPRAARKRFPPGARHRRHPGAGQRAAPRGTRRFRRPASVRARSGQRPREKSRADASPSRRVEVRRPRINTTSPTPKAA